MGGVWVGGWEKRALLADWATAQKEAPSCSTWDSEQKSLRNVCDQAPMAAVSNLWRVCTGRKSCLGPNIKYTATRNHTKKNLIIFKVYLGFCVRPHSQPFWASCGPQAGQPCK